jgi:hypothetical protein
MYKLLLSPKMMMLVSSSAAPRAAREKMHQLWLLELTCWDVGLSFMHTVF